MKQNIQKYSEDLCKYKNQEITPAKAKKQKYKIIKNTFIEITQWQ